MAEIDYATGVVAISTVVLAVITGLYMWETRRMRHAGQQPSFSSETSMMSLGEQPIDVDLVNTGESATDLRIDCSWTSDSKKLYAVSLSKNGHLLLRGLPVPVISNELGTLKVKVRCKDSIDKDFTSPEIRMDFSISKSENRVLTYQYNPTEDSLRDIAHYLKYERRN